MGIYTFLHEHEKQKYIAVSDYELNEVFQEVRKRTGKSYLLREFKGVKRVGLFRKKVEFIEYELYADCGFDAQVINFCRDWDWSINSLVPKSYIMTYFFGILTGLTISEQNPERSVATDDAQSDEADKQNKL